MLRCVLSRSIPTPSVAVIFAYTRPASTFNHLPKCRPRFHPLAPNFVHSQIRCVSSRGIRLRKAESVGYTHFHPGYMIRGRICRTVGITKEQFDIIVDVVGTRCIETNGVRFAYDCMKHGSSWYRDPSSVPQRYKGQWKECEERDIKFRIPGRLGLLDGVSDNTIGVTCELIGLNLLRQPEHEAISYYDGKYLFLGCSYLEVAATFDIDQAAAALIHYCSDPSKAEILAKTNINVNTQGAWALVTKRSEDHPNHCHWQVLSVYINEEFSVEKIRRRDPSQLMWAIVRLVDTDHDADYNGQYFDPLVSSTPPAFRFVHPKALMMRIIEHCFENRIILPGIEHNRLWALYNECVHVLVAVSDPHACFVAALDDDRLEFGSREWMHLMLSAVVDGNSDACWLLACAYARQEGFIPLSLEREAGAGKVRPDPSFLAKMKWVSQETTAVVQDMQRGKLKLSGLSERVDKGKEAMQRHFQTIEGSLTKKFAELAITGDAPAKEPRDTFARLVALAALWRGSGAYSTGLQTLAQSLEPIDPVHDGKFPMSIITKIEGSIEDYTGKNPAKAGYWNDRKIQDLVDKVFDPNPWIKRARETLKLDNSFRNSGV